MFIKYRRCGLTGAALIGVIGLMLSAQAQTRALRTIELGFNAPLNPLILPLGYDETDTLFYDRPLNVNNYQFVFMPNRFGDRNFSMRFSPPFTPFRLVGALIALCDIPPGFGGPIGEPGMKVSAFYNGSSDDEYNIPTDEIGSVEIPFEQLTFTRLNPDTIPRWNFIDLRHLGFFSLDSIDFHIAVDGIVDDYKDTLALFADGTRNSQRSCVYGGDGVWQKMIVLYSGRGVNFLIRAIITNDSIQSVDESLPIIPLSLYLSPAYPNPFNSTTTLHFTALPGVHYEAVLFDTRGRRVSVADRGISNSAGFITLSGANLTDGIYVLQFRTPTEVRRQRVVFMK